jgi:hypothetical protein
VFCSRLADCHYSVSTRLLLPYFVTSLIVSFTRYLHYLIISRIHFRHAAFNKVTRIHMEIMYAIVSPHSIYRGSFSASFVHPATATPHSLSLQVMMTGLQYNRLPPSWIVSVKAGRLPICAFVLISKFVAKVAIRILTCYLSTPCCPP